MPHPLYKTRLDLVGDVINEPYHVLFINNIHCFNTTKPDLVPYGGEWGITLIGA